MAIYMLHTMTRCGVMGASASIKEAGGEVNVRDHVNAEIDVPTCPPPMSNPDALRKQLSDNARQLMNGMHR